MEPLIFAWELEDLEDPDAPERDECERCDDDDAIPLNPRSVFSDPKRCCVCCFR